MSFVLIRTDTREALPLDSQTIFVGSADWKVDLCLAGDGIEEVHCELAAESHGVRVESLAEAGVLVNGQVVRSTLLFVNDRLTIGPFEFRVERSGSNKSHPIRQLPITLHAGISVVAEGESDALSRRDNASRTIALRAVDVAIDDSAATKRKAGVAADTLSPDSLWLVRLGAVELGPVSLSDVRDMLDRGELQATDFACPDGETRWCRIDALVPPTSNRAAVVEDIENHGTRNESPVQATRQAQNLLSASDEPDTADVLSSPENPLGTAVAEPQYFIQRRSGEDGPLPRHAVQDLIASGALRSDTHVRLEWNTRWSNAVELGFAYPEGVSESLSAEATNIVTAPSTSTTPMRAAVPRGTSIRWGLMAPFFYARSALDPIRSLSLKQLAALLLVFGVAGFAAKNLLNQRARTALTGTVLLDQRPLGEVVVTFTGIQSGEVAAALADSNGRFRLLTISGRLSPGPYRITVRPQAGPGTTVPNGDRKRAVPEHYLLLATTDVTVDVTTEQADYEVLLSRMRRL